jgi:hypothetical protein
MEGLFDMQAYSIRRIIVAILIGLALIGVWIYWLLIERESFNGAYPALVSAVGVIIAVLQWFFPFQPPTDKESPDIPEAFLERIKRRLAPRTGAVIVKVNSNQIGEEFHLIPDKARILQSGSRNWRRLVSTNAVRSAVVRRHSSRVYAAVFEDLDPVEYLIWKGRLNSDISDPARRRGITVHVGDVEEVVFD